MERLGEVSRIFTKWDERNISRNWRDVICGSFIVKSSAPYFVFNVPSLFADYPSTLCDVYKPCTPPALVPRRRTGLSLRLFLRCSVAVFS